jgi:histidinol-phosphate aminotransferase
MARIATVTRNSLDELLQKLGRRLGVDADTVIPFTDHTDIMTALLGHIAEDQKTLVIAGHASPDIAIAADRAGLEAVEVLGASPFVSHAEDVLGAIDANSIVYMANPNWVTGSNYSFAQLDQIVSALPRGMLILDEKYHDYYGISALPLLEHHDQIIVIRSLSAGFSIGSDDSGCLAGSGGFMRGFKDSFEWSRISNTMYHLLSTVIANEAVASKRLAEVHNEALRIANELTGVGVQNRITATDFMLLRVADPKRVGNFLAGVGAPVENLEGYPDMANYIRYRIQSPMSNDNFLTAFKRMPSEYHKMADIDKRAVMFHRPKETETTDSDRPSRRKRVVKAVGSSKRESPVAK